MAITKPDLTRIWALTAAPGDIEDPDNVTPGKYSLGWEEDDIPPHEFFNYIDNQNSLATAYINEQGIIEWDVSTVYPPNAYVKGSDGEIYKSIAVGDQSGNDPTTDGGVNWELFGGGGLTESSDATITGDWVFTANPNFNRAADNLALRVNQTDGSQFSLSVIPRTEGVAIEAGDSLGPYGGESIVFNDTFFAWEVKSSDGLYISVAPSIYLENLAQTGHIRSLTVGNLDTITLGVGTNETEIQGSNVFVNGRLIGLETSKQNVFNSSGSHFTASISGDLLEHTDANPYTWTIDDTGQFETGQKWLGLNTGAGAITIAQGTGVTLTYYNGSSVQTGNRTIAQGGRFTLWRRAVDDYSIWGEGIS